MHGGGLVVGIGPGAEHLRGLVQVAVLLYQAGQVYDGVVVADVGRSRPSLDLPTHPLPCAWILPIGSRLRLGRCQGVNLPAARLPGSAAGVPSAEATAAAVSGRVTPAVAAGRPGAAERLSDPLASKARQP